MAVFLIRKLEHFERLSERDRQALKAAASLRVRSYGARQDVVREGDVPEQVNLVLEGWACRYKTLEDGRRQILAYLLPGDFCDLRMFLLRQMDHSVATVTSARVAEIPKELVLQLADRHSAIGRGLWWSSLVEEAIAREWIVNNSQRTAVERVAHLLCELFLRLKTVGLTDGTSCDIPVTQSELADTTGLSTVHVNRTLQELRSAGIIVLRGGTLTVPDFARLRSLALFNPSYLHLAGGARDPDAPGR